MASVDGVNYTRVSGLASGLDTDNIVKQLIQAESYKLNKYKEKEQIDNWKQELYRGVNLDIANFIVNTKKDLELTSTTSSGTTFNTSIESTSWVKQATSSVTSVAQVTATGAAGVGNYTLTVSKLARGISAASKADITTDGITKVSTSNKLNEINGLNIGAAIQDLYINGKKITKSDGNFLDGNSTVGDLVNAINTSNVGVTMSYDSNLGRFFISSTSTGESAKLQITKDGNAAQLDAASDAEKLVNALNLTVTYGDGIDDPLNPNTATDHVQDLNLATSAAGTYKGQNAEYNFAGVDLTSSTNQVTTNGISMTFAGIGTSTINVTMNTDKIVEKVKKFIEDYNGLIDKLSSRLSEDIYRDFKPLTDEQKKDMKSEDIKLWEEKAKSGLVKGDSSLQKIITQLRTSIYEEVSGVDSNYNALYEIGITTKSYFAGGKSGQIQVDETKLRTALQANPQAVLDALFKDVTKSTTDYTDKSLSSATVSTRRSSKGVVGRIYNEVALGIKDIMNKAGYGTTEATALKNINVGGSIFTDFIIGGSKSTLGEDLKLLNNSIYYEERRLQSREDAYYAKFTALEKAMSQLNSQSGWLTQQLG